MKAKENFSQVNPKPFGLKDKLGYLFGDLGNDTFFALASSFLMLYYTNVLGIHPGIIGLIFVIARVWDAFADILWGRFIDTRPYHPAGKFRPWIIRCAPLLVICGALMFVKIPGMTDNFNAVFAFVTYLIWGTLYSTVNIPYGSLASVITNDSVERSALSTFRSMGGTISYQMIGIVVPLFVFIANKPSGERFSAIAVIIAVFAMICYVLCYQLTTERITLANAGQKQNFDLNVTIKALWQNKPFLYIVLASLTLLLGMMVTGSLNSYLFMDYFHNGKLLSVYFMLGFGIMAIVAPLVAPLTKKYGKKEVAAVGMLVSAVAYFLLFLFPVRNVYWYLGLIFVADLGRNFFFYTTWAFVADVIDYHEYLTGRREDGTVYSVYSFTRKMGQALAGGLGAWALAAVGYVQKAPQQTAEVASNLYKFVTMSSAITFLIIFIILAFWYPMTKGKLSEVSASLSQKRTTQG